MLWRIRRRGRGSLGNPNGQTNDRLRTGVNGGGPDGREREGVESPGPFRWRRYRGSRIDSAMGFSRR